MERPDPDSFLEGSSSLTTNFQWAANAPQSERLGEALVFQHVDRAVSIPFHQFIDELRLHPGMDDRSIEGGTIVYQRRMYGRFRIGVNQDEKVASFRSRCGGFSIDD